ncbi:MAG: hypothetical protein HY291_00290 [Planctomycetes bacterium]|nr:hypothetical protein [Planctomycetota bacterium]
MTQGQQSSPGGTTKEDLANLALPLTLLAAQWGSFSTVLAVVKYCNEIRDKVIDGCSSKTDLSHSVQTALQNDWLPFQIGLSVFLLIVTILTFTLPWYFEKKRFATKLLCILASLFPLLCLVLNGLAAFSDHAQMVKALISKGLL